MKNNLKEVIFHLLDRRTIVAIIGIIALLVLGLEKEFDVSMAIATVCCGIAGANAYESSRKKDSKGRERKEEPFNDKR